MGQRHPTIFNRNAVVATPGGDLKLEAGRQIRTLALDRVREIRFIPEKEEMERAWRVIPPANLTEFSQFMFLL